MIPNPYDDYPRTAFQDFADALDDLKLHVIYGVLDGWPILLAVYVCTVVVCLVGAFR